MNLPSVAQLLPLMLAGIMFSLGLTLQLDDFRRVLQRPQALVLGVAGQMVLVPALGFGVATLTGLEPMMAVGLMVLVACPGGVSSGLLTHLARGDVALSIALTAITSVAAMLSLPFVVNGGMQFFLGQTNPVDLPLAHMVRSIFMLTTVPVLIGMGLRAWQPARVLRVIPLAGRMATALFVWIVLATFWDQRQILLANLPTIGPATVLLNALILLSAWLLTSAFGLTKSERIAVATECGLQNSALGIYVAVQLLHSPDMSVPSVVYALLMNGGALIFVALMRKMPTPKRLATS